jgi:hypothetical protein
MPSLRDIVAAQTAMAEELPLVHTTRCDDFQKIVNDGELKAEVAECRRFGGHLLYFFYGRPAYRTRGGGQPADNLDPCPVCFVFQTGVWNDEFKRIHPCDTGALHAGNFDGHLAWENHLDLELAPKIESARKLIPLVFGSNSSYWGGFTLPSCPTSFERGSVAANYYTLLNAANLNADDRRSTIEIQTGSPVQLLNRLRYVVLPNRLLDEPDIRSTIQNKWGASPLRYRLYNHRQPNDYRSDICGLVADELEKEGLL